MYTSNNIKAHQNKHLADEAHSHHEGSAMRTLLIVASMSTMMYVTAFLWLLIN